MTAAFFSVLAVLVAMSAANADYSYVYAGKTVTPLIGETEGVRVNDVCLKDLGRCHALQVFHGPSHVKEIHHSVDANFSGAYCELLHGTQLFVQNHESNRNGGSQIQFCVFTDLTMIDAKALYRSHMKRESGK